VQENFFDAKTSPLSFLGASCILTVLSVQSCAVEMVWGRDLSFE